MEEEYIDVQQVQKNYHKALLALNADSSISQRNKELVHKFLRDASLGKTNRGRYHRKIGIPAQRMLLCHLSKLISYLKKNLDEVTQEDLENFVFALDNGQILAKPFGGDLLRNRGSLHPVSSMTAANIKATTRKFYKWLLGGGRVFPDLVEWIDTYAPRPEVNALSKVEVSQMLAYCRSIHHKALIQLLFDGGFRIGELLNVRLRHVKLEQLSPYDSSDSCFSIRIPFSKTLRRTVVLPMAESKLFLSAWLSKHPGKPVIRSDGGIDAENLEMQLFPMTAIAARTCVKKVGKEALGKRVYPHLLRHTSATFWSNRLSHYRLCKRFGWTMTSSMPQKYIDREGVDEIEAARDYLKAQDAARQSEQFTTVEVRRLSLVEERSSFPEGSENEGFSNPGHLNRSFSFDKLRRRSY